MDFEEAKIIQRQLNEYLKEEHLKQANEKSEYVTTSNDREIERSIRKRY